DGSGGRNFVPDLSHDGHAPIVNRGPSVIAVGCRRAVPSPPPWSTAAARRRDNVVIFFIELASRRLFLAGCTARPTAAWVTQQARNLSWQLGAQRCGPESTPGPLGPIRPSPARHSPPAGTPKQTSALLPAPVSNTLSAVLGGSLDLDHLTAKSLGRALVSRAGVRRSAPGCIRALP